MKEKIGKESFKVAWYHTKTILIRDRPRNHIRELILGQMFDAEMSRDPTNIFFLIYKLTKRATQWSLATCALNRSKWFGAVDPFSFSLWQNAILYPLL